jgi:hypothetical protein
MFGAQLGKTLPSPCVSLDKWNLPFWATACLAGASRRTRRAAPFPAEATRRRSYQREARTKQVGFPADYILHRHSCHRVGAACTDGRR